MPHRPSRKRKNTKTGSWTSRAGGEYTIPTSTKMVEVGNPLWLGHGEGARREADIIFINCLSAGLPLRSALISCCRALWGNVMNVIACSAVPRNMFQNLMFPPCHHVARGSCSGVRGPPIEGRVAEVASMPACTRPAMFVYALFAATCLVVHSRAPHDSHDTGQADRESCGGTAMGNGRALADTPWP